MVSTQLINGSRAITFSRRILVERHARRIWVYCAQDVIGGHPNQASGHASTTRVCGSCTQEPASPPATDTYVFGADHAAARGLDTWDVSQSVSALRPEVREEQSIDLGRMWTGLAWISDYGDIRECVPHDSRGMFSFIQRDETCQNDESGDPGDGDADPSYQQHDLSEKLGDD